MLAFFARRLRELHEVERDERGFTLIELLIVIIIIGILAAIAIPTFLAQRDKAMIATCKSDTRNAAEAAILYSTTTANGDFTGLDSVPLDLAPQGFNQTEGYVTTITGGPPADVSLSTDCAGDAASTGTATWTTVGVAGAGAGGVGDFRGEVKHTIP